MYFVNHLYETDLYFKYFNCDKVAISVSNYLKYNPLNKFNCKYLLEKKSNLIFLKLLSRLILLIS